MDTDDLLNAATVAAANAAIVSAALAGFAALISLGAIFFQYLLLPKPLFVEESVERREPNTEVTIVNRGNAVAYDVRHAFHQKRTKPGFIGDSDTMIEVGHSMLFVGITLDDARVTMRWRQAPFMWKVHKKTIKLNNRGPKVTTLFVGGSGIPSA